MSLRKLAFHCPVCQSAEVFYSCTPNCCFNHVCSDCGATFEPATAPTGEVRRGLTPPDPLPDSTEATAGCAKCDSTAVYLDDDGAVVCLSCGAVLSLEMTEIAAG